MQVHEKLLVDFLTTMKTFVAGEGLDRVDSGVCRDKAEYADTVVRTLEEICGIGPEDYSSRYFCRACGWIGSEPGQKDRDEVYLVAETAGAGRFVFFCPKCGEFEISLR